MLDFPSNPTHNQKLASDVVNYWFDANMPSWQRYEVTSEPPMALNTLSPSFALVNAPGGVALTAGGTSFPADATIQTNGNLVATTFVSSTSLTANLTAAGVPGTTQITVASASLGKTTAALPFEWKAVITATALAPTEYVVGDPDFTLTVTGTGFTADCVIQVDGAAQPTTFVSATELTAAIDADAVTVAGPWAVTVNSPSSAQTTAPLPFTWKYAPVLTSITPSTAARAMVTAAITMTGENFSSVAGEVTAISQAGRALPTTVVNATTCTATLVAPTLAKTEEITVANGPIASRSPPASFIWT